jgi:hypothetical protein
MSAMTPAEHDADAVHHPFLLQASLVRVCRCSHMFILTLLLQHEQFVDAVGADALHFAVACTVEGKDLMEDTDDKCAVQADYPAWFLQQRPASALQHLTIAWEVPLAEVKELVEQHLQQGGAPSMFTDDYTWQGRSLYLRLEVALSDAESEDSSTDPKLEIGCYAQLQPNGRELCKATFKLWLLRSGSTRTEDAVNKSTIVGYLRGKQGWGCPDFVYCGTASSWQQVERALFEQGAVHADGCLHIRVVVKKLD